MASKTYFQMHFGLTAQNRGRNCLICPSVSIYPSVGLSTFFSVHPFIHLNPEREFYERPGRQSCAERQRNSTQCLCSWRRPASGHRSPLCDHWSQWPLRDREVGLKTRTYMRNWYWQQGSPCQKTTINPAEVSLNKALRPREGENE